MDKKSQTSREQKLIDISFQIAMLVKNDDELHKMTNPQLAEWMREQYRQLGFELKPVGLSWGVLS